MEVFEGFLGTSLLKYKQTVKQKKAKSGITCVCSLAGSHRRRCAASGWRAGPSSGFYRSGTRPLSPSRPVGGASGQSETPSSRVSVATGLAPVPLWRTEEEQWQSCHIYIILLRCKWKHSIQVNRRIHLLNSSSFHYPFNYTKSDDMSYYMKNELILY